jgi:hypothetical protein
MPFWRISIWDRNDFDVPISLTILHIERYYFRFLPIVILICITIYTTLKMYYYSLLGLVLQEHREGGLNFIFFNVTDICDRVS